MPETHASPSRHLYSFVLGFADGLTVPFALTVGFSSLNSQRLVVTAGLAELFSGAISMGLSAYLASVTDYQQYQTELRREQDEVEKVPAQEKEEIFEILCQYVPDRSKAEPFVQALCEDKVQWVRFMMDLELKLSQPRRRDASVSALVMGIAYLLGGIFPMLPYFAQHDVQKALYISIGLTSCILLIFGFLKVKLFGGTTRSSFYSAFSTLCIGAVAAGACYSIVRGVDCISSR